MAIIDRLELVEVDIDERGAHAVALEVSERALEFALEAAAVERFGQRIDVDPAPRVRLMRAREALSSAARRSTSAASCIEPRRARLRRLRVALGRVFALAAARAAPVRGGGFANAGLSTCPPSFASSARIPLESSQQHYPLRAGDSSGVIAGEPALRHIDAGTLPVEAAAQSACTNAIGADLRVGEDRRGQRAAKHRSGIDVETVRPQVRLAAVDRRMPVHDQSPMIATVGEERLPDPEQITVLLRVEALVGIDARMDEKAAAIVVAHRQ